jgi:NDP-sugar pyrophosphorylase family protein
VVLRGATIGPNVTIEAGSDVIDSTIENSILGKNVRVARSTIRDSLVGDGQVIEGKSIARSVVDAGEFAPAR